jgi:hypothetical protein
MKNDIVTTINGAMNDRIEIDTSHTRDFAFISVFDDTFKKDATVGLHPEMVEKLRDALIDICPLPVAEEPVKRKAPRGAQAYRGNGQHDWEDVTADGDTKRLRVPGGWLYATVSRVNGKVKDTNKVFVPVPDVVGYAV